MKMQVVAAGLSCAASAMAQTANFDAQTEGALGTTYTENGLLFHDLDQRIPGSPGPGTFVAEDASQDLGGMAGFSSPNALGFGGYSPGPGAAYSRIGSIGITPSAPANSASLDLFHFDSGTGNSIALAAYLNGQEVARDTLVVQGGFGVRYTQFHITGVTFDELRLFGEGPNNEGTFFALADNVTVGALSECYANCDESTTPPILNINDFVCFQALFASGDTSANCDGSTNPPILNVNDFVCFQAAFAAGCH